MVPEAGGNRYRVMIAEDEGEVRAALGEMLSAEPSIEVVALASDTDGAIAAAREHRPDVALIDVKMPGGGGQHATREIVSLSPETRVIALSAYEDRTTVLDMLRAGASGYLVKGTSSGEIVGAIERAIRGQSTLSQEVMAGVLQELTSHLQAEETQTKEQIEQLERINEAMSGERLSIVLQPIFDLEERTLVGAEALSRFAGPPDRPPDVWFAEAAGLGLGVDLELLAFEAALAEASKIPEDAYLAVNFSHFTLMSDRFLQMLEQLPPGRLVVELTEHARVDDYEALDRALDVLRGYGGRLAIDDAGAGFASLRHTLRLAPDIIKLDISLTRGIDLDRARRALAAALISFAEEMDMTIVAEGIETEEELHTLLTLGVRQGQGFLLAHPAAAVDQLDSAAFRPGAR